mgnify:CR=1 FL=1
MRLELHERRDVSFSCRLTFVRTNAAFSASVPSDGGGGGFLWFRAEASAFGLLALAAPPQALSARFCLCVFAFRLLSFFGFSSRDNALHPPTR